MNTYQPGNIVNMSVLFTTNAIPPVPVDPTTIVLRVTDPSGVETDYTYGPSNIIRVGTGNYSMALEVLLNGPWTYRWEGTGAVVAANENRFLVQESAFTNPQ